MMLVEADAVEAELIGELHLVEIVVIELGAELRIVMAVGERHPGRAVLGDGVEIDMRIRHQVEVEELHGAILCGLLARAEESFQRGDEGVRLLDLRDMAAFRHDHHFGAGDRLLIGERVLLREHAVVIAPDQQGRHVDAVQPFGQDSGRGRAAAR